MSGNDSTFARELAAIGEACAATLTRLYDVVAAQQRGVRELTAGSGEPARIVADPIARERIASLVSASAAVADPVDDAATPASPVSVPPEPASSDAAAPEAATAVAPFASAQEILALELEAARGIVGVAPAVAIGALQATAVHAVGLAIYNVVAQQQNLAVLAQAVLTLAAAQRPGAAAAARTDATPSVGDGGPHAVAH